MLAAVPGGGGAAGQLRDQIAALDDDWRAFELAQRFVPFILAVGVLAIGESDNGISALIELIATKYGELKTRERERTAMGRDLESLGLDRRTVDRLDGLCYDYFSSGERA